MGPRVEWSQDVFPWSLTQTNLGPLSSPHVRGQSPKEGLGWLVPFQEAPEYSWTRTKAEVCHPSPGVLKALASRAARAVQGARRPSGWVFLAQLQLLPDLHSVLFSHSPPTGALVALSAARSCFQDRAGEAHVSNLKYSYRKGHHSEWDARENNGAITAHSPKQHHFTVFVVNC